MIEKISEPGKYIRTPEIRLKHSSFAKKRCSISENNPNYKDGRTLKKYYCLDCNKELSSYQAERCRSCAQKLILKKHNPLLTDKSGPNNPMFGVRRYGEENPNWRGGLSFEPYPLGWNNTFKEQIRYRDGYRCQNPICGIPETECNRKLSVHHIDYNKENINPINLISLCSKCHAKTTVYKPEKVKYWIDYYTGVQSDREDF